MKKIISLVLALTLVVGCMSSVSAFYRDKPVYEIGDVDNNGVINSTDALITLQASVNKKTLNYDEADAADINVSYTITSSDSLQILQASAGKRELVYPQNAYEKYTLNFVDASCLGKNVMYVVSTNKLFDPNTGKNYDVIRLLTSLQGLINRNTDVHKVAVSLLIDSSDSFWNDYMSEEGATYAEYEKVKVSTDYMDVFMPFIMQQGIVAWDPNVPSTANVAATVCGIDGYLPVQYSTDKNSIYGILTEQYNVPVKMNLCGMFTGERGSLIPGTTVTSSRSAKNDAYLWALEKYMPRCNPEKLAYTPDGATSVVSNPAHSGGNANSAQVTGIPNHDYFILNQMFFFDLTSYPGEEAPDDPTQPLGTDQETLIKILKKRNEMSGGNVGIVQGFPPWQLKYSSSGTPAGSLAPPRLEWHFVETVGSFNCGIEADAAHPCWMSNGSLYCKYQRRYEIKGNPAPKDVKYESDTWYACMVYSGDFDCSCWLKNRALEVWNPDYLGKYPTTYDYSTVLQDRVPQIYDYIAQNRTDCEYLAGGEGNAYIMTASLFKGFRGAEASPILRTMESGDRAYIRYTRGYYQSLGLTVGGQLINGYHKMTAREMLMQNQIATAGSFVYGTNMAKPILVCNGIPYIKVSEGASGVSSDPDNDNVCAVLFSRFVSNKAYGFTAFSYTDYNKNYATAKSYNQLMTEFEDYMATVRKNYKVKILDLTTFFSVLKESGVGDVVTN